MSRRVMAGLGHGRGWASLVLVPSLLAVSVLPSPVSAAPARTAPAPAVPTATEVLALAPFGALGVEDRQARDAERTVADAVVALGTVKLIGLADVVKQAKKAKRPELLLCEGDLKCLGELAQLVGAARIVTGDVGGLGEGQIVYLKAVRAGSDKESGSTTATLDGSSEARRNAAIAASFRLLAPERYVGTLLFDLDVPDAAVYLDGRRLQVKSGVPLGGIAVGTHALRVTHESYRDWLRFIDVPFGAQPLALKVDLTRYPIIADEMRNNGPAGPKRRVILDPVPWYRRWWIPVAAGVLITAGVATAVYYDQNGVGADRTVVLKP